MSKRDNDWYQRGLANNNEDVIRAILKHCGEPLARWVQENNGSEQDAEDVVMYAFEVMYRKAKSGDFILSCAFCTYFFQIGKFKWLKTLNRTKSRFKSVTPEETSVYMQVIADADQCLEKIERNEFVREKIALLGEQCQQLIMLCFLKEIKSADVADVLNISNDNVRQRKKRCLKKLRKFIDNDPRSSDLYN